MPRRLPLLSDESLRQTQERYREAVAARQRRNLIALAALVALVAISAAVGEVSISKFVANIGNFTGYFERILPSLRLQTLRSDLEDWMWNLPHWGRLLFDTLLMAYCGTLLGLAGGFALCFFAASNIMESGAVRFATRRFFEFCRSVPELVFALIFIFAFQLGPVPGVLAIAIHTAGSLGKLFTEAVENVDRRPLESVSACGAGWFGAVRFGVLPQVLPSFASYGLLRFEVNVRGTSVIGFVGAGGIGQDLLEAIRTFQYSDVSAILVLIATTVFAIDLASEQIRHRLIGLGKP
jgi:phosphonate transport system permease protein